MGPAEVEAEGGNGSVGGRNQVQGGPEKFSATIQVTRKFPHTIKLPGQSNGD